MFNDKQKILKYVARISGGVGLLAYLALTQLTEARTDNTLLINTLTGILTLGFLTGGLALVGLGIYANGGQGSEVSFIRNLKSVIGKAFLYVIIPALVLTAILCLLFLRN